MATAGVQRVLDEVKDTVTCSICMELFNQPKVIGPCQHSFCRKCLRNYIETRSNEGYAEINIPCPYCRRSSQLPRNGVDGFMDNIAVRNIVETVMSVEKLPSSLFSRGQAKRGCCNICKLLKLVDVSAVQYCETRSLYLCSTCHGRHTLSPLTAAHEVEQFKGDCKRHKTPLTLYCLNCRKAICSTCAGHCAGHEVGTYENTLKSLGNSFDPYREKTIFERFDAKVKRLETLIDVVEKARNTTKDEVRRAVDIKVKVVKEEINSLQSGGLNIDKKRREAVKTKARLEQIQREAQERVHRSYDLEINTASDELQEVTNSLVKAEHAFDRARQALDVTMEMDGSVVEKIERLVDVYTDLREIVEAADTTATRYEHRLVELPVFVPDSTSASADHNDDIDSGSKFVVSDIGTIRPGAKFAYSFPSSESKKPFQRATKTVEFEVPDVQAVKRLFLLSGDRVLAVSNIDRIECVPSSFDFLLGNLPIRNRSIIGLCCLLGIGILVLFMITVLVAQIFEASLFGLLQIIIAGGLCILCAVLGQRQDVWICGDWYRSGPFKQESPSSLAIHQWLPPYTNVCRTIKRGLGSAVDATVNEDENITVLLWPAPRTVIRIIDLDGVVLRDIEIYDTFFGLKTCFNPIPHPRGIGVYSATRFFVWGGDKSTIKYQLQVNDDGEVKERNPFPPQCEVVHEVGIKGSDVYIIWRLCFGEPRKLSVASTELFCSQLLCPQLLNIESPTIDRYISYLRAVGCDLYGTDSVSCNFKGDLWMLEWETEDNGTEGESELTQILAVPGQGRVWRFERGENYGIALSDVFGRPLKRKCTADVKFFVRGNRMVASFPTINASEKKTLVELFVLTT